MASIEKTNWLAHRWPIKLETHPYGQWTVHAGVIEGQRVGQRTSRPGYDKWLAEMRPVCLARFVAGRPKLHPSTALIVAGAGQSICDADPSGLPARTLPAGKHFWGQRHRVLCAQTPVGHSIVGASLKAAICGRATHLTAAQSTMVHATDNHLEVCRRSSLTVCESAMSVPMVEIGIVRVTVNHAFVPMSMKVRFARRIIRTMKVPMMFVVNMSM